MLIAANATNAQTRIAPPDAFRLNAFRLKAEAT
jgi:hypothetical protein